MQDGGAHWQGCAGALVQWLEVEGGGGQGANTVGYIKGGVTGGMLFSVGGILKEGGIWYGSICHRVA